MMIVMTGRFLWLWIFSMAWTVSLSSNGMAGTTAYVAATQNLDLTQVQLVVVASLEWQAHLYDRTMALFADAGLPLPGTAIDGTSPPITTLTLTLAPRSLGDSCPGKVLYKPALSLTEPVIIPRNSVVIHDISWFLGTDTHVRDPVHISQLEADVDRLVQQFITDYKASNPEWPSHIPANLERPRGDREPARALEPETNDAHSDASLKDLREHSLHVSVMAGRATVPLKSRAVHQLTEAGLCVASEPSHADAVTLDLELVQRSIDDQCPGKVLYEQGLYLVEQVRIQRNPLVWMWTDTWLREMVDILPPVAPQQLQTDQDALLQQFLHPMKAQ